MSLYRPLTWSAGLLVAGHHMAGSVRHGSFRACGSRIRCCADGAARGAGDQQAWERLVDHYAESIWVITRDFKLSESQAHDVSQATWLRLLEQIDRMDHPARTGSWLAATARDECLRKRGD
jgi:hypothetical protein